MARTVVVVDDHTGFREQVTRMLEAGGYDVVGSCADVRSAVETIQALRPELVLLDVQLPDGDGFDVLAQLDEPQVVVLISSREESDYGMRIRQGGVAGFITKSELSVSSLASLM